MMRIEDILNKLRLIESAADDTVERMKADIIKQVKKTDDQELLDKTYTVLNASGLHSRINTTLKKETDVRSYADDLTNVIIRTPGSYQEKFSFIDGFPKGYIDVDLMLSGRRVKIDNLVTGGEFVKRVFNELKTYSPAGVKGPGEFALAVMSPHISIFGKGDLHIDGKVIEVKASAGSSASSGGGRLGTPGSLRFENVPKIIKKYTDVDTAIGVNVGFKYLCQLAAQIPEDRKRRQFAKELFDYVFEGTNVDKLIELLSSANPQPALIEKAYAVANYNKYQEETKFNGMLIMNFSIGELQYFETGESMSQNLYATGVYLVSKDKAFSARQILSQITLKGEAKEKDPSSEVAAPKKPKVTKPVAAAPAKSSPAPAKAKVAPVAAKPSIVEPPSAVEEPIVAAEPAEDINTNNYKPVQEMRVFRGLRPRR